MNTPKTDLSRLTHRFSFIPKVDLWINSFTIILFVKNRIVKFMEQSYYKKVKCGRIW